MAMLTVNGSAIPAPSKLSVAVFDVSGGVSRSASGGAVIDRTAVKRRLEISWAHMAGDALSMLLGQMGGFFDVAYPDPQSGNMRTMQCYCSERIAGILRMGDAGPVWTDVKMTWTER